MSHPWCSDIERDKAVRAAEDAVPRPALPEWSELPKRVAALEAAVVQLQQHDPSPASKPLLTAEELEAVEGLASFAEWKSRDVTVSTIGAQSLLRDAATLRALLERAGGG